MVALFGSVSCLTWMRHREVTLFGSPMCPCVESGKRWKNKLRPSNILPLLPSLFNLMLHF